MSLARNAEARKAGSANNDADETPSPPISAGSLQNVVEVHVTHFGKPIAYGFVIFFQENWMIKTCTGSQEAQKLWQIEATFQHKKT